VSLGSTWKLLVIEANKSSFNLHQFVPWVKLPSVGEIWNSSGIGFGTVAVSCRYSSFSNEPQVFSERIPPSGIHKIRSNSSTPYYSSSYTASRCRVVPITKR
jgi:hypothetical protein